jgi:quercetin dioxygenase-like cupin family protein
MSRTLPPHNSLLRIAKGDGEHFDIAGAKLTWKVKSDATAGRFCFFEQVLLPGDTVPLHLHAFTESFYVLVGTVTFFGMAGNGSSLQANAGDVVLAQPETFHGFGNESDEEARLLSISVPEHQRFFDAIADADREAPFAAMNREVALKQVAAIGADTGTVFAVPSGS